MKQATLFALLIIALQAFAMQMREGLAWRVLSHPEWADPGLYAYHLAPLQMFIGMTLLLMLGYMTLVAVHSTRREHA